MNCLICDSPLTKLDHEGVAVDSCPSGHGVWLDRGELRQIASREEAPRPADEQQAALAESGTGMARVVAAMEQEGRRNCPECARPMEKLDYAFGSGIVIDSCAEHGVWLDAGEL